MKIQYSEADLLAMCRADAVRRKLFTKDNICAELVWDHEDATLLKGVEVSELPVKTTEDF